ncbi:MAG: NAD-dependent epimerase/dehydratase family protein [Burkholderiales bacterium]|jgi:nucleoside-diphosphate-sugar epimerase|nr:NAD-dependent epimerase/dehydratase family protein [Burkholderiales bacterium]
MFDKNIGLLGASSFVGQALEPMLARAGYRIYPFTRKHTSPEARSTAHPYPYWICVAPIWVLPEHFAMLQAGGVKRIVVVSSTSVFTKDTSSDPAEQATAKKLLDAESALQVWAERSGVEWVVLRPTLIYGFGKDKNISEMARVIQRFRFFPLLGKASGLRQPIHACDVAEACLAALESSNVINRAYNLSGGETLTYKAMVKRIFQALGQRPWLISIPLWLFGLAVQILRQLPRYRQWTTAMAQRMNCDLVFDHTAASADFGFQPQPFVLSAEDLPT